MECPHFGSCGSCSLFARRYPAQLAEKTARLSTLLAPFYNGAITPFPSPTANYRARAEYKIYHDETGAHYAMRHLDKKRFVTLQRCPMVLKPIEARMWSLLEEVNGDETLSSRLFGVEFLSATTGETLITMLYHRPLDERWQKRAEALAKKLDAQIIGRSRKQKVVLEKEYVTEKLKIGQREWTYRHYEQSFTQPNPFVNRAMISWAISSAERFGRGDFCELYAGSGNFTLPLSPLFDKIIATEISKRSIQAAHENLLQNGVSNVTFVRMSSEEFTQALEGRRAFRRLAGVDLRSYDLQTVLVDPPRAGLDEDTRRLISRFETVIYISCNPETLARDLEELNQTHVVADAALFDQFAYTPHMEAGVVLVKKRG